MFGPRERLFDVEGETTSIAADVAELDQEIEEIPDGEVVDEAPGEIDETPEDPDEVVETPLEDEPQERQSEEFDQQVIHPFDRPSIKQLSEAYPDLFKKFPSLRDMYFREAEFTKIFPTVEDAREASENNDAFASIRADVFNGTGEKFISAIKEVDEKGLLKFAGNFLPNLMKSSQEAFFRAANPLVEDLARQMFQKGAREKDENLQNSARYLAQFFFGDIDFAEGKKTSIPKVEEKSDVAREREEFDNERHQVFSAGVQTDLRTQLDNLIVGKDPKTGKSRIDPDEVLTQFVKDTIMDRVRKDLGQQLQADKAHIRYMDSLWNRAKKNGRTDVDKASIISAYLARAKQMIPSIRSKYVSEALGKSARGASQKRDKVNQVVQNGGAHGRPSRSGSKGYSPKSIDYNKTSDLDILNDTITYR